MVALNLRRPLPRRQLLADRRADPLRQLLGLREIGGGWRGRGGSVVGAEPVRQAVSGRGVGLRAAESQQIAGRDAQDAGQGRQVLDPEIQAAVQELAQVPVAHLQRPLDVAALEPRGVDGPGKSLAERTEIIFEHAALNQDSSAESKSGTILEKAGPSSFPGDNPRKKGTGIK